MVIYLEGLTWNCYSRLLHILDHELGNDECIGFGNGMRSGSTRESLYAFLPREL